MSGFQRSAWDILCAKVQVQVKSAKKESTLIAAIRYNRLDGWPPNWFGLHFRGCARKHKR